MTITLINPFRAARRENLISTCTGCDCLIFEATPGIFKHVKRACKECFGTDAACAYPELHGVHEYTVTQPAATPGGEPVRVRVTCTDAQPHLCGHCRRVMDAAELPCPDHRSCCGCCDPW